MSRHSKNSTAASVFRYAERQKLKGDWGTKDSRLGRDSLRDLDSCCLCLHPVTDCLSCPQGHLFCKSCIYEYLLAQKDELKRQQEAYAKQQKGLEDEELLRKHREKEAEILRFDRSQGGSVGVENSTAKGDLTTPLAPKQSVAGHQKESERFTGFQSTGKKAEEKELEKVKNDLTAKYVLDANNKAKEELRAFWVPQMMPETKRDLLPAPPKDPQCPMDKKPLKLKNLVKVHFTEGREAKQDQNAVHSGRYQCPSCFKSLLKGTKCVLIRSSGSVLCSSCVKKFVKPEMKCFTTGEKLREKDLIEIQTEGTGYAGHQDGGEKLVAKKFQPSMTYA